MFELDKNLEITVGADIAPFEQQMKTAISLGEQFGRTMSTTFERAIIQGQSFGDVLKSLALSLSKSIFNAALKPVENALGSMVGGLFGDMAFAKGGVIGQGSVMPFAKGGVISSPVNFPMAGGKTGLAGEAGSEAIMPLTRGADGRLGVQAAGAAPPVSVTVNISTPDMASFRRSEGQIGLMMNRAISRANRGL